MVWYDAGSSGIWKTWALVPAILLNGFPGDSSVKNLPVNAGDRGLIPGAERFPGGRNSNLPQDSYLGNPMDREAWRATVHGVTKESDTTQLLNSNLNNQQ